MKLTVRDQLVGLSLIALVGLGVFAIYAESTMAVVGVNGSHYRRIAASRDLIADVHPPTQCLIESYLVVQQLLDAEPGEIEALARRQDQLRAAFEARRDHWVQKLPQGPIRDEMVRNAIRPAEEFLSRVDQELVPAVRAGQRDRARALVHGPLRSLYERHRAGADRVATLAAADVDAGENAAGATLSGRMTWMMVLGVAVALLMVGIGFVVSRGIVRAIDDLLRLAKQMAGGDLTGKVFVDRRDELGELAGATNTMADSFNLVISHLTRRSAMLANASGEMSSVSDQMSATAEETSSQASMVSASAEQVTRNMQTVAVAVEEMEASIQEISKSTNNAAQMASLASVEAGAANDTVHKLGASSSEIGDVVQVINSIAEQTNLLALNAAIEAARAGEAGKGFAVVANEVKELARETALATKDIHQKIQTIQGDTSAAVTAIAGIGERVQQIKDITNTIASAIDEQLATTAEIGRNLNEAARGSTEITHGVLSVAQAAKETAAGSVSTQSAASELARMAAELRGLTVRFRLATDSGGGASGFSAAPSRPRAASETRSGAGRFTRGTAPLRGEDDNGSGDDPPDDRTAAA